MDSPSFMTWNWETKRLISRGAFGDIHEVVTENNVTCAAKTIRLPLQLGETKPEIMKKLDRAFDGEKRLCVLDHQNIVKFYDMTILTKESSVMVFMELVNGPTLEKYIAGNPLSEKITRRLAVQICSALNYLHTLKPGIVLHRDINSRSIMVGEGDIIKLIDFGLAIQLVESASNHLSANPRGDPCFMAPELFLSDDTEDTPYSCASDIWAFGCTVYQMAFGRKPHHDCKNMLAIVRRVKRQGAPELPSSCSDALKDFYKCCTAMKREDRLSAAQLLQHPFLPSQRALPSPQEQATPATGPQLELQAPTAEKQSLESYPMTQPNKGLCLVINVDKYQDQAKFPSRPESTKDVDRIRASFDQLGFNVVAPEGDLKAADIWNVVHGTASSLQASSHGCFVCFIMAYGAKDRIYGSDGDAIGLQDMMKRFQAAQCAGMNGKPKLFFVQSPEPPVISLSDSDVLLCGGDSFVQTLCDTVEDESFRHVDIDKIIGEVTKRLGRAPQKKMSDRFCALNTASTLSKRCCLDFPALPVDALPECPESWTDDQLTRECNSATDANKTYGLMKQTLLTIAATKGKQDLVTQLLKVSLQSVSAQDVQGRTAICWAALKGHRHVLEAFEKAFEGDAETLKVEVNRADRLKQTPIILAAKHHQTGVLVQLKKMGADVNAQDAMQYSAVTFAAKLGHKDTVTELLGLGADPKALDVSGNSPLIWAARCNHSDVIRVLGDQMKDAEHWKQKGERDMTAQEWAKFCGHIDCAVLIQNIIRTLVHQSNGGGVVLPDTSSGGSSGGTGGQPSGSGDGEDSAGGNGAGARRGDGSDGPAGGDGMRATAPYPMPGQNRGIAIIVNIVDFPQGSELRRRAGAMEDTREGALYQAFTNLGFDCRVACNVNGAYFDNLLTVVCTPDELKASQVFLLCIMSHGEQDYIFASDGAKVLLEDVFARVRRCRQLQGKPKLFVVQACRDIPDNRFVPRQDGQDNAGKHEDCLYLYSVVRGDRSLRHADRGGLFSRQLCEVIAREYDRGREDFGAIVPKVVRRVLTESEGKQVPCSNCTLTRPLIFPDVGMSL